MSTEKVDRRVRRTRKLLLDSLTRLLEEKDLNEITVKEITDYSDLNRGTFYLHYKDVYDMMNQIQKEIFDEFNEILRSCAPNTQNDTPYNVLYQSFLYLEKNKELGRVLMGPHGDYQFILSLRNLVKEHISKAFTTKKFDMENFEFFYSYFISGILGLIQYWLETNCKNSPLEMAELVNQMILKELSLFSQKSN